MKVLFDHCTPRPLRQFLTGHDVTTAERPTAGVAGRRPSNKRATRVRG